MRDTTILGPAALLAIALGRRGTTIDVPPVEIRPGLQALAGGWRSGDGIVRLTLEADHRYVLSVTGRARPARGSYLLDGADLRLCDDSGLWTPARVDGDVIELAGRQLLPIRP
jgi:hypothetical protein